MARTNARLFMGVYPTGIVYADKSREKDGDYARCAFLSFSTLELQWEKDCPGDLRAEIERDAARIQSMRGQPYPIDASGHTVILGGRPHAREAPRKHMRAPRGQHVVADFNTIDDLIAHAARDLGATHALIAGPETRLYFPRGGQYPYEEARVRRSAGYWHAEGPGARSGVSHLPSKARPIAPRGRRAAEESGGFLVDKFYLVDRVTGGTLGGPFDTRREANREKRSKSFGHDLYIWQARHSEDMPPHTHAASRP